MELKKWIFLIGIAFIVMMLSGCVEETVKISSEDIESISINKSKPYKTVTVEIPKEHWYSFPTEITTGRVIEITFRKTEPDIIVFGNGTVKSVQDAECYTWQLGKIYSVTTKYYWYEKSWIIAKVVQEKENC